MFDVDNDGFITENDLDECQKEGSTFTNDYKDANERETWVNGLRELVKNENGQKMDYANFKRKVIDVSIRMAGSEETPESKKEAANVESSKKITTVEQLGLKRKRSYTVGEVAIALKCKPGRIRRSFKKSKIWPIITRRELEAALASDTYLINEMNTTFLENLKNTLKNFLKSSSTNSKK